MVPEKRTGAISLALRQKLCEQSECWVITIKCLLDPIKYKALIDIGNAEKSALLLQSYKVSGRKDVCFMIITTIH